MRYFQPSSDTIPANHDGLWMRAICVWHILTGEWIDVNPTYEPFLWPLASHYYPPRRVDTEPPSFTGTNTE